MPDGQDRHCFVIDPVQNYIAAVAEVDQPFTEGCVEIIDRAAESGLANEHIDAGANRLDRAPGCGSVLVGKKAV